jgi:ECF sigma factor
MVRQMEQLAPVLQRELHRVASHHLAGERRGHILQATALVNEAYLRLIDWKSVGWQNRAHFFAIASQMMRRILVDYARAQHREKRGGGARQARIVELRFFGGLSLEEMAEVLDVSVATVRRDWSLARAWLYRELRREKE